MLAFLLRENAYNVSLDHELFRRAEMFSSHVKAGRTQWTRFNSTDFLKAESER